MYTTILKVHMVRAVCVTLHAVCRPEESCCTLYTVALTDFSSRSLPAKVHLKKNPEAEKLDGK
jgi:hypothetical protein